MTRPDDTGYSITVRLDGHDEAFIFESSRGPTGDQGWRHPTVGHVVDVIEMYTACVAHVAIEETP